MKRRGILEGLFGDSYGIPADRADFSTTCRGSEFFRPGTGLPGTQRLQDKDVVHAAVQQDGDALFYASEAMRDDKELEALLRPARVKLLAAREQRVKPQRDDNILTSWNAMMVSAYLDAYHAFGTPAYLAAAERALTFLLDYAVENGRVYRTVTAGKGRLNG